MPRDDVWSIEQVVAFAGTAARFAAGESIAVPNRWAHTGSSERALWGRYDGSSAEPYEVVVDHVGVAQRCSCPSRAQPCKHVIALLALWVRGHVPEAEAPSAVERFVARTAGPGAAPGRDRGDDDAAAAGAGVPAESVAGGASDPDPDRGGPTESERPEPDRTAPRDERLARLRAGLVELDRWLEDRMRTGLADPSIARYSTWDELAARLTDARAGALANRVRRLAGRVGTSPEWHVDVLEELGILHLIAVAGQRVPALPADLADAVAVLCGWQVRAADVAASAPETDTWLVAGRSDTREDLVEVRRVWLYGTGSRRWALSLSFAAYQQSLDATLVPGSLVTADVHRYPGATMRAIVGERHRQQLPDRVTDGTEPGGPDAADAAAVTVEAACAAIGDAIVAEPWLERVPVLLRATVTSAGERDRLSLSDHSGSLPLAGSHAGADDSSAIALAASAGSAIPFAAEWTTSGLVALTAFVDGRAIDVGPRADASFVSAA